MSSSNEIHVCFRYQDTDYDLSLVKGEKSEYSVGGYAVLGDKEKLKTACDILKKISLDSVGSEKNLKERLSALQGISFPVSQKVDDIRTKSSLTMGREFKTERFSESPLVSPDDDLNLHERRINAIQDNLTEAYKIQDLFYNIGNKLQSTDETRIDVWAKINPMMEQLIEAIDAARSQAGRGEFSLAEASCNNALKEFEKTYLLLEKEIFASLEKDVTDESLKKNIKELFGAAREIVVDSLRLAASGCKESAAYLAELNKGASVELGVISKEVVNAALTELSQARETLQKIWDGQEAGDLDQAKLSVKQAQDKCQKLCWEPGNAAIAKKQMKEKAQLAASLIPKATADKIIQLATQEFGSLSRPGIVSLEGAEYEVAHDILLGEYQIIRLPKEEEVLGKGAWNVVVRVCNISKKCFQALRKPISPPGEKPPGEEQILRSIEIYKDISRLKGTTVGPEALIRKGVGGVLSSMYSDDLIKWLRLIPPPQLRLECFKSVLNGFIEFAKDGNVHGDIHPGNLSVVYAKKGEYHAVPKTIKIEDLDGACHLVEGTNSDGSPIYNKKGVEVGIVCKYATQQEVDKWIKCIGNKDLDGIAQVRFGQDILALGITLYQILTLDFDIHNLYLSKKCSPFINMNGEVVEGRFEEGIFIGGKPNVEALRLSLEEFDLTTAQKEQIIKFLVSAITQNTEERAQLHDLEVFSI